MRPKLRTLITDIYKDVSYVLDDDGYSMAEYQDVVRKRFVKAWESLVDGYKVGLLLCHPNIAASCNRTGYVH
jgi:conserved oligomeric Golgi complex subunit 4